MKRRNFLGVLPAVAGINQLHLSAAPDTERVSAIATWNNEAALNACKTELERGAYALDAVESGVKIAESNPDDTSVGFGGLPDVTGKVSLDACIMDENLRCGSVSFVRGFAHPISIARAVMEQTDHVMLVGEGAEAFAKMKGFEKRKLENKAAKEAWKEWKKGKQSDNHDTIGMLASDKANRLCGACSTSGRAFKLEGRVGDSPIIGAGLYVDGEVGGAAATGMGEQVLTTLGTYHIVELMRGGLGPQKACEKAIDRIIRAFPKSQDQVAYIALSSDGRAGFHARYQGFEVVICQDNAIRLIDSGHTQ